MVYSTYIPDNGWIPESRYYISCLYHVYAFSVMSKCHLTEIDKVRKKAKIRNRYNQVLHLTQETTWESGKNTRKHHTQESQEVSPFPAVDHKARQHDRHETQITKNTHKRSTALERSVLFTGGLKLVSWYQPHPHFL